jgi:GT2 family glycosyltransferase
MRSIAVAIVSYNTCELLRKCLDAVQQEAPSELIVIDNASSDGSVEMIKTEFPSVTVRINGMNLGYGAAANQAIVSSTAKYVCLLNSDAQLQSGALEALNTYLEGNPRVAIVGPRIVNPDGTLQPSCFPFPTPLDIFLDVSHLSRLIRYVPILQESYPRTWSHTRPRKVPWVLGAALGIRREAFDIVGGFDESFYMFYEEADLCYRLQRTGWQVHFAPVTAIIHVGGASTQQRRADMTVQFFASLMQFYRRHFSLIRQAELIMLIECIALTRMIRDVISLGLTGDSGKRADLAVKIDAWRRLLLGHWRRQVGFS